MKFDDILILFKIFRLKDFLLLSQSSNNMIDFFWPYLASHHKSFVLILNSLIDLILELRDSFLKELQFFAHTVFVSICTADLCDKLSILSNNLLVGISQLSNFEAHLSVLLDKLVEWVLVGINDGPESLVLISIATYLLPQCSNFLMIDLIFFISGPFYVFPENFLLFVGKNRLHLEFIVYLLYILTHLPLLCLWVSHILG